MARKMIRLMAFWPRNWMGLPGMVPCSLPAAISDPVVVSAPNITSNPNAPRVIAPISAPCRMNSPTPTSAAANAPKAGDSAVRCGIEVMGTNSAIHIPMIDPMVSPTRIHPQVMMCVPISVPTMAMNIPPSAMNIPRRAVSG